MGADSQLGVVYSCVPVLRDATVVMRYVGSALYLRECVEIHYMDLCSGESFAVVLSWN